MRRIFPRDLHGLVYFYVLHDFTQKITFTNAERLSNGVPLNTSAGIVPADPENVGDEFVPAGVKLTVEFVGTAAGQAIEPAGVIEETPPDGLAELEAIESPEVTARADPPVAVEVITCVPVVAAVVLPWTVNVDVIVCVWFITLENGVPENVGTPAGQDAVSAGTVPADPVNVGAVTDPAGVNAAVELDPAGVIELLPPVVPTSPFAAIVP
jgi:hypothetical protein